MSEDIFIHVRNKMLKKISSREILFIQANDDYSKFITVNGNYLVKTTLSQIEATLSPEVFCRVHRSYIIPIERITNIDVDTIHLNDQQIPLAKQYRENLLNRLKIFK